MDALGSDILYFGALVLTGIATFLIANNLFSEEEKFKAAETLGDVEEKKVEKKSHGFVLQYSRPFFKRYVSPIVGQMKSKQKIRNRYKKSIANAGLTNELTPDDFYAFKLFLILGFPITYLFVRAFGEFHDWPITLAPIMGIVGFFYPDIWIRGVIQQRQVNLIKAMPFVVDMLALSVEAGLDFMAAISKVVEKAPPSALSDEFEILLKEVKIGSSRAEALRNLAWRTNVIQISSFCATLIAADSVGASIGPILKTLSGEIRQKRSSEIEKEGAKAATKMLFPMMFLIVPAVMIVVFSPIILEYINRK